MSAAMHTPGPWLPVYLTQADGVAEGWYVSRTKNGWIDWLPSSGCSSRFATEAEALAAIAKATGSAS